jgi:hypothetical protein
MSEMLISPSNSEHNSDQEYMMQGTDEAFELAFLKAFKHEKDQHVMSEESEEIDSSINNQGKIFEEDLTNNKKEEPKEEEKKIVGIKDVDDMVVEIKMPPIFKIYKGEDGIAFTPAENREYYEKYKSNLVFNVWKDKKTRKEMPDEIRKKIKSRFFKDLKKSINKFFIISDIEKKMEFLPQEFISNISKPENKSMLNKTLEQIILENLDDNSKNENNQNKNKNNLVLLDFLKEKGNKNNYKIKKIYNIFNTQIKELFHEYLKSNEFEESLKRLKEEGNYSEYIKDYIIKAEEFVNYFSN